MCEASCYSGVDAFLAFRFTEVFVCEFRSVVCLNYLYFERKCPLKHHKEFHGIFRRMFFKSIDKPYSGAFVDGCPLIKVLSVPLCSTFKTVVGHFLNIHLYFFFRNKKLRISPFIFTSYRFHHRFTPDRLTPCVLLACVFPFYRAYFTIQFRRRFLC